jgi:hypothetical protein
MSDRIKEEATEAVVSVFGFLVDDFIKSAFDVNNLSEEDQAFIAESNSMKQEERYFSDAYYQQYKESENVEQRAYDSGDELKAKTAPTDWQKVLKGKNSQVNSVEHAKPESAVEHEEAVLEAEN